MSELTMRVVGIGAIKMADGSTSDSVDGVKVSLPGPGLHDFQGACGTGKTTLIACLEYAVRRDGERKPSVSFEKPRAEVIAGMKRKPAAATVGQVTLPGMDGRPAGLKVGESDRITYIHRADVDVIDGRPFFDLTRPSETTDAARAKTRQRAFADLAGARVRGTELVPADLAPLVSHIPAGSLLDVSAQVADALHAERRTIEGSKTTPGTLPPLQARLAALEQQISGIRVAEGAPTVEAATAALSDAQLHHVRVVAEATARQQQEQQRAEMLATLTERPDLETAAKEDDAAAAAFDEASADAYTHRLSSPGNVDVEGAHAALERAQGAATATRMKILKNREQIAELERQIVELESRAQEQDADVTRAADALTRANDAARVRLEWQQEMDRLTQVETAARTAAKTTRQRRADVSLALERWEQQQQVMGRPITGPTQEDVAVAEAAVAAAQKALGEAKDAEWLRGLEIQRAGVVAQVEALTARAEVLRAAVSEQIPRRSQEILEAIGVEGWKIVDGEVVVRHPVQNIWVQIDSLSTGELDRATLQLLLARKSASQRATYTVLILPQEVGQGLDEKIKRALGDLAREKGIYIITATMVSEKAGIDVVTW